MTSTAYYAEQKELRNLANPLLCDFPVMDYDMVIRDCGDAGVHGTQGCWCPTHGLMVERKNLEQDRTAPDELKMLDSEREACLEDIKRYQDAAMEAGQ